MLEELKSDLIRIGKTKSSVLYCVIPSSPILSNYII